MRRLRMPVHHPPAAPRKKFAPRYPVYIAELRLPLGGVRGGRGNSEGSVTYGLDIQRLLTPYCRDRIVSSSAVTIPFAAGGWRCGPVGGLYGSLGSFHPSQR
jgi:hypothetical protein